MRDNKTNSKKGICAFNKLFNSIDNLLVEEKEQKLKLKLGKEIKDSIFTNEIIKKINEDDISDFIDGEDSKITALFSSIFPIFVKNGEAIFRLYKHKIEVDLSDEMKDRYIYIFSDGRLTSGIFQCFSISDDEYVYGIKKIIDTIPLFRNEILSTLEDFEKNINIHNTKVKKSKNREQLAEKNYNELLNYLSKNSAM